MDGGGLVINNSGRTETVWRRERKVYACEPGKPEQQIGEGMGCTIESINGKNIYAWTENGQIVILKPQGIKERLGKGSGLVLKAVDNDHLICVWEHQKRIYSTVVTL